MHDDESSNYDSSGDMSSLAQGLLTIAAFLAYLVMLTIDYLAERKDMPAQLRQEQGLASEVDPHTFITVRSNNNIPAAVDAAEAASEDSTQESAAKRAQWLWDTVQSDSSDAENAVSSSSSSSSSAPSQTDSASSSHPQVSQNHNANSAPTAATRTGVGTGTFSGNSPLSEHERQQRASDGPYHELCRTNSPDAQFSPRGSFTNSDNSPTNFAPSDRHSGVPSVANGLPRGHIPLSMNSSTEAHTSPVELLRAIGVPAVAAAAAR